MKKQLIITIVAAYAAMAGLVGAQAGMEGHIFVI